MAEGGAPVPDDRGAIMRQWLIRFTMERPFQPFLIRLEGGFEVRVLSIESVVFERGVLALSVYDSPEVFEVLPVDRIVSLKIL